MLTQTNEKYDSRLYGSVKADFLNRIDKCLPLKTEESADDERRRLELLKEIKDGKFIKTVQISLEV